MYSLLKIQGRQKNKTKKDNEGTLIHILALCILMLSKKLKSKIRRVEMLETPLWRRRGGITKTFMFTKCQVVAHMLDKMLSACNSAWYSSRKDKAGEATFINMYIQSPKAGTHTDLGSNSSYSNEDRTGGLILDPK